MPLAPAALSHAAQCTALVGPAGLVWGRKIGGAIGGGVIAYTAGGQERIAVATGLTELIWPTEITTAKISILGL